MKLYYKIKQWDGVRGRTYNKTFINPLAFLPPLAVAIVVWYLYGRDMIEYCMDLVWI